MNWVGSYLDRVSVRPGLGSLPNPHIARFTRGDVVTADIGMKRKMSGRREAAAAKRATTTAATAPDLLKWPPIKPKQNLQISRLKDTDLFTVQNFLTSAESQAFVKVAESVGFVHQGSLGPAYGEAFRDNDRISVNDPSLANTIWECGLNKLFDNIKIRSKSAIGLNPNIRLYRYKTGQRFGRHIDESNDLGEGKKTHYTLLIYLSGGSKPKKDSASDVLVGGETVFYNSRNSVVAEVAPLEGMALFHIHGDKCMLHEARNVTKGVKYVLRSDVVFA